MNQKMQAIPFYILMILAMTSWGAAWVSAKMIAGMSSPQIIILIRYSITALSMLLLILYRGESFLVNRRSMVSILLSALFLYAYSQCFFKGLETGLAGAGGVLLTSINPLITYVISSILLRRKFHKNEWSGVLVGILGGFFLLKMWQFSPAELVQSGNGYFVLGAVVWSLLSLSSQKAQEKSSVFVYSFYLNLFASVFSLVTIDYSELQQVWAFPPFFWGNILFLALIGTTFGTTAYFFSTQRLGAAKGSSFIFLVPVTAVVFSYFILDEIPQWWTLLGGALAIVAVTLIHKKRDDAREVVEEESIPIGKIDTI